MCGSDGVLYCDDLPLSVEEIDLACCPAPPAAAPDAAAPAAFDGALPAGTDAAADLPDAAANAGPDAAAPRPAGPDAGPGCSWGDAGDWFTPLDDKGLIPHGADDAGVPYLYRCGFDVCHPRPYDGGIPYPFDDAAFSPCGPLGCQ
jgi:hypothetical protein